MQRRVACATWCKQHYRPVRVTANSRGSRCMTLMLPAGPWALPSPRLADQGAFSLPRKAPYFFTASPLVAAAMNSCCGTTAASHGGARHWLAALANRLAKRNGHEDALRRSRATANRILGTLRAALNHAYAECRVPSDNTWRGRLKPFRNVAVARKRYLTVPEAQRLLNAAEGGLRDL